MYVDEEALFVDLDGRGLRVNIKQLARELFEQQFLTIEDVVEVCNLKLKD